MPLELFQPSSADSVVSLSLSETATIFKTTEETNKESTLLLPGFTLVKSWKPTTEGEVAEYPSVKKKIA